MVLILIYGMYSIKKIFILYYIHEITSFFSHRWTPPPTAVHFKFNKCQREVMTLPLPTLATPSNQRDKHDGDWLNESPSSSDIRNRYNFNGQMARWTAVKFADLPC